MKMSRTVSEMFGYERESDDDTIIDNYDDSSSDISMPSDVTVDSDSHSENDTDNNNQGRKSWGDGGDIYPPCFDMGGVADIDDTRSDLDSLY